MPSLSAAQAKWERKTGNAGAKWDSKKSQMIQNFGNSSKYAILGVSPGPMTQAAYAAGVNATSGSELQQAVQGKGGKWADNFRRGFGA